MAGAGAGIGGNGGAGGNANSTCNGTLNCPITDSGGDGESGEDCGLICIYGDLEIYAYGGAGGAGGYATSTNSGSGAGGYPAAGIGRRWSWSADGGEHACSAGGYTAGNGEGGIITGENGLGSTGGKGYMGAGGGYYSKGSLNSTVQSNFGQGGIWSYTTEVPRHELDHAGSGGDAGSGGTVYYYDLSKIYAYNGDRITNDDYTTIYYEYEADGTLTSTVANTVTKLDGKVIVPAKIFAQSGIIRATYVTNQRMTESEALFWRVEYIFENYNVINVKYTEEIETATTDYGQGIGSGAGNLEKSNGTLKPISEYSE